MDKERVTLEVARLARKVGYDEICDHRYSSSVIDSHTPIPYWKGFNNTIKNSQLSDDEIIHTTEGEVYELWDCVAPKLFELQEWLRINHNIEIWSQPNLIKQELLDDYVYFIFVDRVIMKTGIGHVDSHTAINQGFMEALRYIEKQDKGDEEKGYSE